MKIDEYNLVKEMKQKHKHKISIKVKLKQNNETESKIFELEPKKRTKKAAGPNWSKTKSQRKKNQVKKRDRKKNSTKYLKQFFGQNIIISNNRHNK